MAPSPKREVIDLVEDDSASDQDGRNKGKRRKLEPGFSDKIHWTDDSDGGAPVRPKKRRAKRKSAGKERGAAANEHGEVGADELEMSGVPEYLQERRRAFDDSKRTHLESGLKLPPDYTGITFDETRRLGDLEERPVFDAASGVRPSRPYEDIELPHSGGLIPASIARYLRDYQVEGVRFLHRKFVFQEGGILGDDMGLGKTVQVAAFLTAAFGKTGDERDAKRLRKMRYHNDRWYPRILIICPGTLIMNWTNELSRWGWWHIDLFHGANKDDVLGTARAGLLEIMITTYDTYKNSRSSVNMVQWDAVIADECHRLKDRYSETARAMQEVNALCRIGLTGTAIQNRYEELWTLLDWTNPGHFGTLPEWRETVSKPLAIGQSHEATMAQLSLARQTAQKLVQNLLPRYFLRRMKSLIAHQLPKKTDRVVFCPLTDLQREAYENFVDSDNIELLRTVSDICKHGKAQGWCCRARLADGTSWQKIVFPSMVILQKLSNHLTLLIPQTTDLEAKQKSELAALKTCMPTSWKKLYSERDQIRSLVNPEFCGKWKVLKKLLKFWHGAKDKVLVFSHSVRLLRILQHLFHNTSYNVSYLDGSMSYEARQETVDNFNSDPSQFVFLISTKAGGVGLNITSANKVVIVDPHWNPSYDLQAQDRAYRIGQTRDVEVFRLVSLGTVEEIVYARQIYKQQQANIGYTASSERRYFKGVQEDAARKGEIFGLGNIFTYHSDSGLLRDIVNKTNIAEAKAGVSLTDVDMEQAARDHETIGLGVKEESGDGDGGVAQLADLLKTKNQQEILDSRRAAAPRTDAVQAILASAGVEYTHDNSEVIGSSKVEEQLSRRAAMAAYTEDRMLGGDAALFAASSQDEPDDDDETAAPHRRFKPPEDVQLRQFCDMARTFGFANATEFALVVESWSGEARRNCLDIFYRGREAEARSRAAKREDVGSGSSSAGDAGGGKEEEKAPKSEIKDEVVDREIKVEGGVREDPIPPKKKEVKDETVKGEVKDEKATREDPVPKRLESAVKAEAEVTKPEAKASPGMKNEDVKGRVMDKLDGKSKRTSIFLSDDDGDGDEL